MAASDAPRQVQVRCRLARHVHVSLRVVIPCDDPGRAGLREESQAFNARSLARHNIRKAAPTPYRQCRPGQHRKARRPRYARHHVHVRGPSSFCSDPTRAARASTHPEQMIASAGRVPLPLQSSMPKHPCLVGTSWHIFLLGDQMEAFLWVSLQNHQNKMVPSEKGHAQLASWSFCECCGLMKS